LFQVSSISVLLASALLTHFVVWHGTPLKIKASLLSMTAYKLLRNKPSPAEEETAARRKIDPHARRVTITDLIENKVDEFRSEIPRLRYILPVMLEVHEGLCLVVFATFVSTTDTLALFISAVVLVLGPLGFWVYTSYRVLWLLRRGLVEFHAFDKTDRKAAKEELQNVEGDLDMDVFTLKGQWIDVGDGNFLAEYGTLFEDYTASTGAFLLGGFVLMKNVLLGMAVGLLGSEDGLLQTWLMFLLCAADCLYTIIVRPYIERKENLMVGCTRFEEMLVLFFNFWTVCPGFLGLHLSQVVVDTTMAGCK
jgi:hypothetical protein